MKPSLSRALAMLLLLLSLAPAIRAQENFSAGRYYDLSGVKHIGFIAFTNDFWGVYKINFKSDSITSTIQTFDIGEVKAVVVMHKADDPNSTTDENQGHTISAKRSGVASVPEMTIDSFVVVKEATGGGFDPNKTTPRLCRFVVDAVNTKIYSREVQKHMGNSRDFYLDTLYLSDVNGQVLQIRRNNYKLILTSAFSDYPELVRKIQNKDLMFWDLDVMIATYIRHKSMLSSINKKN